MATTNATTDEVRVALKPLTTTLEEEEIEWKIDAACELVNTMISSTYTRENEPTNIKFAIVYYAAYDIIMTIFFDENLDTIRWRWNDVEIEHGQNAFAIRDFAFKLEDRARRYLTRMGTGVKSATSTKSWETKSAGRPEGYYYSEDSVDVT